jgi:hypothetical protein
MLLDRGIGRAGVAINPVPIGGIVPGPTSLGAIVPMATARVRPRCFSLAVPSASSCSHGGRSR